MLLQKFPLEWWNLPEFIPARPQNLVLALYSNTVAGRKWMDASGKRNHGTFYNHTVAKGAGYKNKIAPELYFDGIDDYINTSKILNTTQGLTIELLFKYYNSGATNLPLIASAPNSGANGFNFGFHNANCLGWYSSGSVGWLDSTKTLSINKIYHAIITAHTDNNCIIYIDGLNNTSAARTLPASNINTTFIGCFANLYAYSNFMSYIIRIYNKSLSPAEIKHNYTHNPYYYLRIGIDPQEISRGLN